MTRRRGPACLATTFLTLAALSACTQPNADAGTSIDLANERTRYFAASPAGAFLVNGDKVFTVAEQGAPAQPAACCFTFSDGVPHSPSSGSVALDGTPWVVLDDGSAMDLTGKEHATAGAVRRLNGDFDLKIPARDGKPATTRRVFGVVNVNAVSVVDSSAVLASTYNYIGSTRWHSNDSVVYRVSASGTPVAVAGRPGLVKLRPVSGLVAGERVAATDVDLERVQALVALDQNSFILFMIAPQKDVRDPRLQAAVVTNGLISRLKLPDLCVELSSEMASRVSDHEVVLSALKRTGTRTPSALTSSTCASDGYSWIRIDTAKNTFTEVGSGYGFAAIAGDQLITATSKTDQWTDTTVRWQDLPASR